ERRDDREKKQRDERSNQDSAHLPPPWSEKRRNNRLLMSAAPTRNESSRLHYRRLTSSIEFHHLFQMEGVRIPNVGLHIPYHSTCRGSRKKAPVGPWSRSAASHTAVSAPS